MTPTTMPMKTQKNPIEKPTVNWNLLVNIYEVMCTCAGKPDIKIKQPKVEIELNSKYESA